MKGNPVRIYADTSVFGGAFDKEFARASKIFLDLAKAKRIQLVISPLVVEEIGKAPEEVKNLYGSMAPAAIMLEQTDLVVRLQEAYLKAGVISPKWQADALHVAYATVNKCQMIVSWNFRHIANYQKIPRYNAINLKKGYREIAIYTPLEVIGHEEKL